MLDQVSPSGYAAKFKVTVTDQHGGKAFYWDHRPVARFDEDGLPLVLDEKMGRLVGARNYANFDGVSEVPTRRVVLPGGGWRCRHVDGFDEPVLGWIVDEEGWGAPLLTDGTVQPHDPDKPIIYHPESGSVASLVERGVLRDKALPWTEAPVAEGG